MPSRRTTHGWRDGEGRTTGGIGKKEKGRARLGVTEQG